MALVSKTLADILTVTRGTVGASFRPVSYGSNLIRNPELLNAGAWVTQSSSCVASDGVLTVTASGANGRVEQGFSTEMIPGRMYEISVVMESVSASARAQVIRGADGGWALCGNTQYIPVGNKVLARSTFVCPANNCLVQFIAAGAGDFKISAPLLREVVLDRAGDPVTYFVAPINTPCIEFDPVTGKRRGVLSWESRTNYELNSSLMNAAPGVLPAGWGAAFAYGVSYSVVGTGVEDGIPYVDIRVYGTPTSTSVVTIETGSTASSNGQQWRASRYIRPVSEPAPAFTNGGAPIEVLRTQISSGIIQYSTVAINRSAASLARGGRVDVGLTAGSNGATVTGVVHYIQWGFSQGVPVDATYRIGGGQIELGATASPLILTYGAQQTRQADMLYLQHVPGALFGSEMTLVAKFVASGVTGRVVADLSKDSADTIGLWFSGLDSLTAESTGGGNMSQPAPLGTHVAAFSVAPNSREFSVDGAVQGSAADGYVPSGLNRVSVGMNRSSSANLNGIVCSIRVIPRRRSGAALRSAASLP